MHKFLKIFLTAASSVAVVIGVNTAYGKIKFSSAERKKQYALPVYYTGNYYDSYDTSGTGAELLEQIGKASLAKHNTQSYAGLWTAYATTDIDSDGKIWDMYSNYKYTVSSDQCGTYSVEGDCYNREHTVPQSWFNKSNPYVCDIYHIFPTDGKVNGMRSNYPHGDVESGTATYTSGNGSMLGTASSKYYTGKVFEVLDEYKGDFARAYLYMAATYHNDFASNFTGSGCSDVFTTSFPYLTNFALDTYIRWSIEDPVSEKEQKRNETGMAWQGNRNPFVDNQNWVIGVWGEKYDELNSTSYFTEYKNSSTSGSSTSSSSVSSTKTTTSATSKSSSATSANSSAATSVTSSVTTSITSSNSYESADEATYKKVTSALDDYSGKYLITYDSGSTSYILNSSLSSIDAASNYVTGINSSSEITSDSSYEFTIESMSGGYAIKGTNGYYIGCSGSSNALSSSASQILNTISFSGTTPTITSNSRTLQYNSAGPRFRYYSSSQNAISLYKKVESSSGGEEDVTKTNGEEFAALSTKAQLTARGYETPAYIYSKALSTTSNAIEFDGNSSGNISINLKATSKAAYIKSIQVVYDGGMYTYTFASGDFTADGTKTLNSVSWTLSGSTYLGFDSTLGLQLGSKNNPSTNLTLSTDNDFGTVKSVIVTAACASSGVSSLSCSVNDNAYYAGLGKSYKVLSASIKYAIHISSDLYDSVKSEDSSSSFGFIIIENSQVGTNDIKSLVTDGMTKEEYISALSSSYSGIKDLDSTTDEDNFTSISLSDSIYTYSVQYDFIDLANEYENSVCVIGYSVINDKIYLADQASYSCKTLVDKLLTQFTDVTLDETIMLQAMNSKNF